MAELVRSPAAGPAGDTGSAGISGSAIAVPATPPQLADQHAPAASPSLYGPLAAALLGALVAQGLAAGFNYWLRSRTDQAEAFDRVFIKGMAARRALSRYRKVVNDRDLWQPAAEAVADAITEFRAAELNYQARFGGSDETSAALAEALKAVSRWTGPELSDFEMEELAEEEMRERANRPYFDDEYESREQLRTEGQQLEDKLNEAMAAFGRRTRRLRRLRGRG